MKIKKSNTIQRKKNSLNIRSPYSEEEIRSLIKQAKEMQDVKNILLLKLLLTIAPRPSEIANLKWQDVFHSKKGIYLNRKGGEVQLMPICSELEEQFNSLYKEQNKPIPNSYVFSNSRKEKPDRFDIYNILKKIAEKSGVKYRGTHLFRHNLATEFDKLNVRNSVFLRNFGWKDERVKQIYVFDKEDEQLRELQINLIKILNI